MIYQILIRILSPLVLLLTFLDGLKRGAEKSFVLKRLGFLLPDLKTSQNRIWIHCASVGEVKVVEPLLKSIMASSPDIDFIVTTNTASAQRLLQNRFQNHLNKVNTAYCPLDYPFAIRQFLNRCKPTQLWVIETEIWPNLYNQCFQSGIPIRILNGRISKKTLNAPAWLKRSYQQALQQVEGILARSQKDADNFIQLGSSVNQVAVLGNLKFAPLPIETLPNPIGRDYVLVASTHEDEELQIVRQWLTLKRPELLVIVPRHPSRSDDIQNALLKTGVSFKVASRQQETENNDQVFLDDRIGFLMPLYQHAKLVIMGGSFVAKGGHNFIEPAFYKKAIITGFDNSNFEDEFELLNAFHGIIRCQNYTELSQQINRLLDDPKETLRLGEQAYKATQTQQDILDNYLQALHII